jgi:hypothetical protein
MHHGAAGGTRALEFVFTGGAVDVGAGTNPAPTQADSNRILYSFRPSSTAPVK